MACTVFLLRVAVGPLEKFGIVSTGGIKSCCAIDASGVDAESVGSGIFGSTFSYDKKIPQQIISGRRIFCVIPSNSRFCPIFRDGIFPRCMRFSPQRYCVASFCVGVIPRSYRFTSFSV